MRDLNQKLDTILALLISGGVGGSGGTASFEVVNVDITTNIGTLAAGESKDIQVTFPNIAIIRSVNIKTVETELPFSVTIKDGPTGIIEYKTEGNREYCYDVINTIYMDSTETETLYFNITNDSTAPINIEHAIIRGLKL